MGKKWKHENITDKGGIDTKPRTANKIFPHDPPNKFKAAVIIYHCRSSKVPFVSQFREFIIISNLLVQAWFHFPWSHDPWQRMAWYFAIHTLDEDRRPSLFLTRKA